MAECASMASGQVQRITHVIALMGECDNPGKRA
jgi:hypothetical protein